MNLDAVCTEFIRWAILPILITVFCVETRNVVKALKKKFKNPDKYIFCFWGDWFLWYVSLLFIISWVIFWVFA